MDNRELFSGKSVDYAACRPSYPAAAIDFLYEKTHAESVADIGAGSGIFTACLQKRFKHIIAVEPNGSMRNEFMKILPEIPCTAGCAEAALLPENSVQLITAAQAFHWFDEEKFKSEAMRILRPGGKTAIIWNNSIKNDFVMERDNICREYCPRFRSGHAGKRTPEAGDIFLREYYFKSVETVVFDNPFVMDEATFAGNIRSRSYALRPDDSNYDIFMEKLNAVFHKYAKNGVVTEPISTQIYLGSF